MFRIARNADPASWIRSRLHPFGMDVGSFVPEGFAAYARVFHPPYRLAPEGNRVPVRWRDIAAANNRTIAAEMELMDSELDAIPTTPEEGNFMQSPQRVKEMWARSRNR